MRDDAVTMEIIRHRLDSINDEAATTLQHVSGSQIAVESNDLNTAITTADGRVVACGRYILAQVASIHLVVADILANYSENPGIAPGDQFLTNDPYVGTLHQPDVVVVAPVFAGDELVAWVGSTVHQADVGGPQPGGMTLDARSIYDEPIPMAPIRIVEGDRVRRDIEREYLIRSRTPELNRLDLAGQIAANRAATAALLQLCDRYGTPALTATMQRMLDGTEGLLRARLAELPDGRWRHNCYLEHGGSGDGDIYAVRLCVTKRGDELELDFSDSSDQAPGAINTAYPALAGFTMAAVLVYLCGGLPWVPGALWPAVRITTRPGSLVHAQWPAGVAMSTATGAQAIRTCVNACLARMIEAQPRLHQHLMAGCQLSSGGGVVLSGRDQDGTIFAGMTLDEVAGGGGARGDRDGADSSGSTTSPGGGCANIEVNESYLPVRYLMRRELVDSAGPGRFRGGVSTVHLLTPHASAGPIGTLSFGQGLQHPGAVGLAGGGPGCSGAFVVVPEVEAAAFEQAALPTAALPTAALPMPAPGAQLQVGEVLVSVSQGGGGFGDPLDRDPEAVLEDYRDGLISARGALTDYGVVLREVDGQAGLDAAASTAERAQRRERRLGGRQPLPAREQRQGRPLSAALDLVSGADGDGIACARCGVRLCAAYENVHEHLLRESAPVRGSAPFTLRYRGAERFEVRSFHCPGCAQRIDTSVALTDEPVLHAIEPLVCRDRPADGDDTGSRSRR